MSAYTLVLPQPWQHVPLTAGMNDRVAQIVAASVERLPDDVPPDQRAQARIKLEGLLLSQLRRARDGGGSDFYLPTDLMHGMQIGASFVVSVVTPDASAPDGITGKVLARLVADAGSRPVTAADTVWARSETSTVRAADETIGADVASRRVEYVTAMPSDERRWVIVSFSTVGDGDPDSEFTGLLVDLFDAIMSTWRWTDEQ